MLRLLMGRNTKRNRGCGRENRSGDLKYGNKGGMEQEEWIDGRP